MTEELLVTPEQLDQTADEFKHTMENILSLVSDMQTKVDSLKSRWEGTAADAYTEKSRELFAEVEEIKQMIDMHVDKVKEVANNYRSSEAANTDAINQLASNVIG